MSPEYAFDGIFSVKSDVFSFGVLTLEIVSGQRNKAVYLSEPEANLVGKVSVRMLCMPLISFLLTCLHLFASHFCLTFPQSFQAWQLWREGRSIELLDPSLGSDFSFDEVLSCINVGLLCVQQNPEARPTMSSVVLMLSNQQDTSFYEPKEPGFMPQRDLVLSSSINEIAFSNEAR